MMIAAAVIGPRVRYKDSALVTYMAPYLRC